MHHELGIKCEELGIKCERVVPARRTDEGAIRREAQFEQVADDGAVCISSRIELRQLGVY